MRDFLNEKATEGWRLHSVYYNTRLILEKNGFPSKPGYRKEVADNRRKAMSGPDYLEECPNCEPLDDGTRSMDDCM